MGNNEPAFRRRLIQAAVASCFATAVHANPTGPSVISGAATFNAVGNNLTVTNSPGAIINWQGFSIRADEVTRFIQSGAASAVLNRVTGAEHSQLLGQLLSNGKVFLINPNGVTIGAAARIDTAGFVASSLALSNEDFLAGKFRFTDPGNAGKVTNAGTINAHSGGPVYLVAPTVENHGVITAPNGDVMLAAGRTVELVSAASPHLRVQVQAGGEALNVGQLVAESGRVGLYGAAVRNSGLVSADSAQLTATGTVVLKASKDVTLDATSTVTANGPRGGLITVEADGGTLLADGRIEAKGSAVTGGDIRLLGTQVGLVNQAAVDASGAAGGGTVNVGGSRQGEGPLPNSRAVFVGADARIAASATAAGDGGTVIVYADEAARIYGAVEARGGPQGGNGGFIETSGKQFLDVTRLPDVTAPAGSGGLWLIDPFDITITTTAGQCTNLTGCVAGPNWTSSGTPAQLGVNLINNALNAGTSVTVTTGAGGAQPGNVTFANNAAVNKTAGGNAALTVNATNNITFNANANITSTSGQLAVNLNAGAGGITNLRNTNTNGGILTLNSSGAITQTGVVAGTGSLIKDGAGTLTLSQANTYTGATTINAGTVTLSAANRIADASAVTVAAGATFNLANNAETVGSIAGAGNITLGTASLTTGGNNTSTTFSGVASGTGGLTKAGTGTLTLGGVNTYTGATTINAGTLALNGATRIADTSNVTVAAGATFDLANNSETVGSIAGAGNVALGAATLTAGNAANQTYSGVMSGTGGLTKQGTGALTLSGANTYTGATTINAGTVTLGAANRIADASAVTVAGGATFNLAGFAETVGSIAGAGNVTLGAGTLTAGGNNASTVYSGVASGTGGLTKAGTGTLTLSGANTYTGATTINGGTVLLAAADRIANGSAVTVAGGATFDLAGFNETVGSIAGAGSVVLGAGTLTAGGNNATTAYSGVMSGTGGLTKVGTGTLTLSGANTYTGTTTISAGTLALGGAAERIADASAVVLNGGTFNLAGFNETVASISGTSNITLGAGTLTAGGSNASTTYSGIASGTGGITKVGTGTLTLGGVNTYTGATTINAGTVALNGTTRIADTSNVTVAGGATLDLAGNNETVGSIAGAGNITLGAGTLTAGGTNATTTYSGVMSGTGGFAKAGTGTLTLSGANTYSGATAVNAGTLVATNAASLGTTGGATTVANNAALNVVGVTIGETLTISGTGVGATGALRGTGTAAVTGPVTLNANSSIGADAGATLTVSGAIGEAGGARTLTKVGTGTLVLSGANTYTGATTVSAGTLTAANATALGTPAAGATVAAGATLNIANVAIGAEAITLNGTLAGTGAASLAGSVALGAASSITTATLADTLTVTGAVTGAAANPLNKDGAGTLVLGGAAANTYAGVTNVNAGTLVAAKASALGATGNGTTVANGATLQIANVAIGAEPVTLNGTGVGGAGALQGTGTASLTGNVVLNSASSIGAPAPADTLTLSGVVSGANDLTKVGSGTVVLAGAAANTYSGATNVSAGTLRVGSAGNKITDASAVTVAGGASLDLNNFAETVGSLAGAGNVTLGTATLTAGGNNATTIFSGVMSGAGGLTKQGTGALTLSGPNSYNGATTVSAGTLTAAHAAALGSTVGATTVAAGATLNIDNSAIGAEAVTLNGTGVGAAGALQGTGTASLAGNVALNTASSVGVGAAGDALTLSGTVSGANALTKVGAGTLTLAGANTYTGTTTVSAGTLVASNANALGSALGGATTVATGATLSVNNVTLANTSTMTIHGNGVGGAGALIGTGVASLNNPLVVASASRVGAAPGSTLALNGAITGANALDAAGGGTVTFGNTVNIASLTTAAGTTLNVNGGAVTTSGAQTYAGPVVTGGATTLTANAITATGQVTATAGTLTLATGAGDVTMTNPLNNFGTVAVTSAGNVNLRDADAITLGGATATGSYTATAGGAITQSALMQVSGSTTFNAGSTVTFGATNQTSGNLTVTAGGPITQTAGAIQVGGNATFDTTANAGIGSVSITGTGNFTLGNSTAGGNLALTSTAGSITLPAGNTLNVAADATLSAAGAVTLNGTTNIGGNLQATGSSGGIFTLSADTALDSLALPASGPITVNLTGRSVAGALLAPAVTLTQAQIAGATTFTTATAPTTVTTNTYNLTQSAAVAQPGQTLTITDAGGTAGKRGNATLPLANDFGAVGFTGGDLQIRDANALTLNAASANAGTTSTGTVLAIAGTDLTLGGNVNAAAAGTAATLVASGNFLNPGSSTVTTPAGRWLVYSTDPAANAFGALASGSQALWGRTYPAAVSEPGNRYVFSTQPTLTFTSTNVAKTYGQDATATVAGAYAVSGFVDAALYGNVFVQDNVANAVSGTPTVTSLGSPATAAVAGSPYAINVNTAGVTSPTGYSIAASSTGQLTVNPAGLTVTADNQSKTYGQTVTFSGTEFTSAGLQNGETIGSVTLVSAGAPPTASVAGSPYAINASNATGGTFNPGNYTITYNNGTLTVAPAALNVTANNQSKTYGQTLVFTGTEFTSAGLQNGETIGSVTLASAGAAPTASVAGSPYAINASNATGGTFNPANYAITYNNGVLTVGPAALSVTANNQSKTYGQTLVFTGTEFTSAGLQNGETIGSVTLASAGAAPTASVAGSPYVITASNASGGTFNAGNYTITYNNGTLTVAPAALSVTANNQSKTYGQTFVFTGTEFTSAGLQNGETIGSITLTSPGAPGTAGVAGSPYAINASNATGGTFNPGNYAITYNGGLMTVNPAALSVTASNQSKTYGQTIAFTGTEFLSAGLQNGETIGSVTLASAGAPPTASVAGSPYAITASNATGGTFNPANYTITYNNGVLTVSPAALTVTANNQAKTYGQTVVFAGTEFTSAGLQNGETIGSVTLASAGAPPTASVAGSPYAINASNATGGTFNPANYAITYNNGVLTVSPAALTVTANNQTKVYGQTFVFNGTEFTSAGLQNGETIGAVTLVSAGAAPTATVPGSPYAITASNATGGTFSPGNYTITYNNGVMTVTPLPIVVTANNQAKVYGQPDPALTFTAPTVNGDVLNGALVRAPGENVVGSPYAITQGTVSNANNPNYQITFVNGQLVITPGPLAITADDKARAFGAPNPPFTATATGFQFGETMANLNGTLVFTTPATTTSPTGTYPITPGGVSSGNYTITFVDGVLVVAQGAPPADQALVTAVGRSQDDPTEGLRGPRALECLTVDRPGDRRVLSRCF